MLGVAIWGLWKINSRRHIGEEDQNSKYYQTGGEFTIFFSSTPQPEPNVSWNLEVSIINAERKSTRRSLLVLTQGVGKGSSNPQRKCDNPTSFLLSSFFPFFISCTPGLKQCLAVAAVASVGLGRSLNLRGRESFLSNLRSYDLKRVEKTPLLFYSFCSSVAWLWLLTQPWQVHSRMGLMKPQLSPGRLEKGSPREPEDFRRMRILGNWSLKVA